MIYKYNKKKIDYDNLSLMIKNKIKNDNFLISIMKYYDLPESLIDSSMEIRFKNMSENEFAKADDQAITINKNLFNGDVVKDNFHFIVHEFWHWVQRQHEKEFYFNDLEEIQAFVVQIAFFFKHYPHDEARQLSEMRIKPLIDAHFNDEKESDRLWDFLLSKAESLIGEVDA